MVPVDSVGGWPGAIHMVLVKVQSPASLASASCCGPGVIDFCQASISAGLGAPAGAAGGAAGAGRRGGRRGGQSGGGSRRGGRRGGRFGAMLVLGEGGDGEDEQREGGGGTAKFHRVSPVVVSRQPTAK